MHLNKELVYLLLIFVEYMMAEGHRPHLRSKLAQSVYDRMLTDEKLRNMDFSTMYTVKSFLLSSTARDRYIPMEVDVDTKAFIDACFDQADYVLMQMWHTATKAFLGMFMTQTSINGLLNRGRMFVWSKEQAKVLLSDNFEHSHIRGESRAAVSSNRQNIEQKEVQEEDVFQDAEENLCPVIQSSRLLDIIREPEFNLVSSSSISEENLLDQSSASSEVPDIAADPWWSGKIVLDLGAGDGYVTQIIGDSAKEVYATETSPVMRKRLSFRGYKVIDAFSWAEDTKDISFDLITCLNLLDRCDKPVTILKDIYSHLSADGKLVVALVLPISPYVEAGRDDHQPSETLGITGDTLEEQVNCLIDEVFPSLGFTVIHWSNLPYLCEGDLYQAFYWLPDIVLVLSKTNS